MIKALWLCSWYPNREQIQNGDFVQRLAHATALYSSVTVLHIARVNKKTIENKNHEVDIKSYKNLIEIICLYSCNTLPVIGKVVSSIKYLFFHLKEFRKYKNKYGRPDVIHVQVAFKSGLIAYIFKKIYRIPYVITEHWTQYLENADDNYSDKSVVYKYLNKLIFSNAENVISVSTQLKERLDVLMNINCTVIPNVVDESLFFPNLNKSLSPFTFVHISSLTKQKNPEVILKTFQAFHKKYENTRLVVIGPKNKLVEKYANESTIIFTGMIEYNDVANYLRNANASIIYSSYETFCCVIPESLYCSVPVISTKVGVAPEIIIPGKNGFLIDNDKKSLFAAMERTLHIFKNKSEISERLKKTFDYSSIGQQINDTYNSILK